MPDWDWERADHLPEYTRYQDTGCEAAPSCLRCPLVRCKYDPDPAGRRDWLPRARRGRRDAEMLAFYRQQCPTVRQLAERFGVSIRTVHRVLASARRDAAREAPPIVIPRTPQADEESVLPSLQYGARAPKDTPSGGEEGRWQR